MSTIDEMASAHVGDDHKSQEGQALQDKARDRVQLSKNC